MTPVQLPEVPEPEKRAFYVCTKCGFMGNDGPVHNEPYGLAKSECGYLAVTDGDLYTAAQLREYATEAIRLNMKQFLPACEALKREAIREQIGGLTRGDPGKIANADRLIAILTQPEQNSGR